MAPLMEHIERQRALMPHSLINVTHNAPKEGLDTLDVETGIRGTSNAKVQTSYTFDRVFSGVGSSQVDIFIALRDSVHHVLKDWKEYGAGGPSTIFAYGQTGSGKTYTMFGGYPQNIVVNGRRSPSSPRSAPGVEDYATRGIVPRAINELFNLRAELLSQQEPKIINISCSFL